MPLITAHACEATAGPRGVKRPFRGSCWKKVTVSWQGEGLELARRLRWEALRGGLGRCEVAAVIPDSSRGKKTFDIQVRLT